MFCNMMVLLAIACCKELHQPMFILLFSLPISDMIGTTAFLPQLLWSIVTQYRSIPYTACITQAFLIHMYGTGNLLILSVMANQELGSFLDPMRLPRCKSVIMNVFCDNPSLLKLTCVNTTINNVVGLFNTAVIQAVSLSVQAFSYVKILIACMVSRRFNTVSADLQKIMGMLIFLIPPLLNPIVYGLYTGEIRNAPLRIIKKRSISV
ncbi:Olfactory receptor 1500 [Takifugu flavidus]|uniref:Olfactory receptor 1500 n=1 Tax=Takifugu flavidus TaxID=433684 RepID=A0A5C6PCN2_9TELE|nr:Olfactory receptor 1500 [Takifugu flavidus]